VRAHGMLRSRSRTPSPRASNSAKPGPLMTDRMPTIPLLQDMPRRMRLPFFYGWLLVAIAFVTMAIGVNARTAFSLLFPAILDEFGWERGMTAGAFSFGFLVSALATPGVGWLMDRRGPMIGIGGHLA